VNKKAEWGLVGPLVGGRMSAEGQQAILGAFADALSAGVSGPVACQVLQIPRQRLYRWQQRLAGAAHALAAPLRDRAPGPLPGTAPHRLLAEEKALIATLAREEATADLSLRQLAVVASEEDRVQVSAASFYRYAPHPRRSAERPEKTQVHQTKPVVDPTGPHQVWSWDLTDSPVSAAVSVPGGHPGWLLPQDRRVAGLSHCDSRPGATGLGSGAEERRALRGHDQAPRPGGPLRSRSPDDGALDGRVLPDLGD
jgi:hypothetical protein